MLLCRRSEKPVLTLRGRERRRRIIEKSVSVMPKKTANKKSNAGKSVKKSSGAKTLHVVARAGHWVIRNEGSSSRAVSVHETQKEAVEAARKLAKKRAVSLVIHGRDGRVKSRVSYRPDPPPP